MGHVCTAEKSRNSARNRVMVLTALGASLLVLLLTGGCVPSAQIRAQEPATPEIDATNTATSIPSLTEPAAPPATETSTAIPVEPLALIEHGLSGWCLPPGFALPKSHQPGSDQARLASVENDTLNFQIPASSCTLVMIFNQPPQPGMRLQFFEGGKVTPWLETELNPVAGDPNSGFATLHHSAMMNVGSWEIRYPFALVDASGVKIADGLVRFFRPFPGLCWEGSMPDPITLACPFADALEREPHPDVTLPAPREE